MLLGISTDLKALQLKKAYFPIFVTLFGITTDSNEEQFEKTDCRIVVIPLPISHLRISEQPLKAYSPISVTLGITTDCKDEHSKKALRPMVVTLSGILIDFIHEHPSKA